jgi:hypothetical protein
MPRPAPFVETDLQERGKCGFAFVEAKRAGEDLKDYEKRTPRKPSPSDRFCDALRALRVGSPSRAQCELELGSIFGLYDLRLLTHRQETPARKAQSFRREQRWRKRRERLLAELMKQSDREKGRLVSAEMQRVPRLPPALEQEMWRHICARKRARRRSAPGEILANLSREY